MATTIKLKRGTTTPTTSNIVDGELGIDTSAQKIYINDSGTIKELAGGGSLISDLTTATGEPMGHADRTESTIAFDTSTRIYSITPVSTSFDVWCAGTKYTYSSAQTVTLPTTSGLYYIYFDSSGVLSYKTTYFTWHEETPTGYVYYNADSASESFFFDERHGITLDWQTHEYLHRTRGAVLANGLSASYYGTLSTNDGSSDDHYKVKISNGTFFDEDLEVNVTHAATPTGVFEQYTNPSTGGGKFPVLYKIGSSGLWRKSTGSDVTEAPYRISSSVPQYNLDTAGTWSLANVGNNKFFGMWLVATNTAYSPIVAIAGQEIYDNLTQAKNNEVWTALNLSSLPLVEYRPLYRLIFEYNSTYTNTGKTALRDILDVRALPSQTSTGVVQNDHGNLFGLGDDDHPQYVHVDNARTITADHTFTGNPTFSGDVTVSGTITVNNYEVWTKGNVNGTFSGALAHTLNNPNPYSTPASDYFGRSVSISGDYAIIGAVGEDDVGGTSSGKAYIFDVTSGTLVHILDNPNAYSTSANDNFGYSVAMSGNYAIVGAYYEDDAGGSASGKAYIFNVASGTLVHTLDNPNAYGTSVSDTFGESVAISGNYAIVGAKYEDDAGGSNSGKAYIFDVTSGTLVHTLDNPNAYSTSASDYFGQSVSISGNYAIVGAYYEDDAGGSNSGKAYIFNVTTGALVHTLDNPNPYDTSVNDQFGNSVAISGNYAIVGAKYEDDAGGSASGKAYIFNVTTGALVHTLDNPNAYGTSAGDNFGYDVSINGDYAIVGACYEDDASGSNSGKAYIFDVTSGTLIHTLDNPNAYGTSAGDQFGIVIAISEGHIIIGVYTEDDVGATSSGKVYIYELLTPTIYEVATLPSYVANDNSFSTNAGIIESDGDGTYSINTTVAEILDNAVAMAIALG